MSKNAVKWWLIGSTAVAAFCLVAAFLVVGADSYFAAIKDGVSWVILGFYLFLAAMTASLARKWMPLVRTAEKVFDAMGWPDAGKVDLVKSSRVQRRPDDDGEFGTFYFRY